MKKINLFMLIVFSNVLFSQQKISKDFELIRTIELDSAQIIGAISEINIKDDGSIVIQDITTHRILEFSENGKFICEYNSWNCFPGNKIRPEVMCFFKDKIFWGNSYFIFRFENADKCNYRRLPIKGYILRMVAINNDNLFLYVSTKNEVQLIKYNFAENRIEGIKKRNAGGFEKIIERYVPGQAGLLIKNGLILCADVTNYKVFGYDTTLILQRTMNPKPAFYKSPLIPQGNIKSSTEIVKMLFESCKDATILFNLLNYDDNRFVMQYYVERKLGIVIVNLEGNIKFETVIKSQFNRIYAVKDKLFYFVNYENLKNGTSYNPQILVYRLNKEIE